MSRNAPQQIEIHLLPTEEQVAELVRLLETPEPAELAKNTDHWYSVKPRFGAARALVIRGSTVATHELSMVLPQIGTVIASMPIKWRGVGLKKDYLCVFERNGQWTGILSLIRTRRRASKKGEPASVVSGGLPSLGKRR